MLSWLMSNKHEWTNCLIKYVPKIFNKERSLSCVLHCDKTRQAFLASVLYIFRVFSNVWSVLIGCHYTMASADSKFDNFVVQCIQFK